MKETCNTLMEELSTIPYLVEFNVHKKSEMQLLYHIDDKFNPLVIKILIKGAPKKHEFYFAFRKKYSVLSQYYEKYYHNELGEYSVCNYGDLFFNLSVLGERQKLFESDLASCNMAFTGSRRSCEKVAVQFSEDLEFKIIPLLDRMNNIHILNELSNKPYDKYLWDHTWHFFRNVFFDKMIIARLAGDACYHDIYNLVISTLEDRLEKRSKDQLLADEIKIIKKIYKELHGVNPLENPILDSYKIDYEINEPYEL